MKICIDAGHGGKDSGAVGTRKTYEKDHVLEISKMAGEYAAQNGYEVVYTRETDKYLSLSERAQIANRNKCDVFISIHNNSYVKQSANGMETWSFPGSAKGYKLSKLVQKEIVQASGLRDRGSKVARFGVLRMTNMVAVLVEVCFISNPNEELLLMQTEFKRKMAKAIIRGVSEYLGIDLNNNNPEEPSTPPDGDDTNAINKKTLILKTQKFLNGLGITDYQNKKLVEDGIMGKRTKSALEKLEKLIY